MINSKKFIWDSKGNGCAMLSDLGAIMSNFGVLTPTNDITIQSSKTGAVVSYTFAHAVRDDDGDVMYWTLIPSIASTEQYPNLRGTVLRIFND